MIKAFIESVDEISDDSGWAFLGSLGNYLVKKKTDFDPRNYGFSNLSHLIKRTNAFIIEARESGKKNIGPIYLRNKPCCLTCWRQPIPNLE
ncbi:MAG: OST-HTH/LOTUS domain-containing protein [Imperialibacter sp.]|uniref:OST-HTH/LOTUS domain-containing protein n=1 Tax=Imperialibacter sp. TaxID=2038411 RepID=UPI003A898537